MAALKFNKKNTAAAFLKSYSAGKRQVAKMQWYLLVIIIMSPVIYFSYMFFEEHFIPKAEGFVSFNKIEIRSPFDLFVDRVFIGVGDKVKPRQKLIQLDAPEYKNEILYIEKEIDMLNGKKLASKNPELEHLAKMKTEAIRHLQVIKTNYKSISSLRKRGLSTFFEAQQARIDLNEAIIQVHEINKKIAESKFNYNIRMEELYDSKIRSLNKEILHLKQRHKICDILAPTGGTIVQINVDEKEFVTKNKELLAIATDQNMHIKAFLPSRFLTKGVAEGGKAMVKFPDGVEKVAVIMKITKEAQLHPNEKSFIKRQKNRVVVILRTLKALPVKYKIFGLHVEVFFDMFT
ncbi:HlyD family efflux transporter periplasmic adaptor subunit [Lentisphaerota bacterium ZTH]|nr:HlyD family efflux transporter periplasmic adaptor subunit [Lentisphaerota bacterium]WET07680.1 HlyD family efflux transporter periplasmic adaptor subunit [Lentisphaerota bacterium ZTH]